MFGGDPPGREQGQHRDPASTTRAARSPSSLACWLASRAAVAVSSLTSAWSSAAWRSASEMNGTPPASSTLAWALTESGTAGFCWIPVRNELVRKAIRIDPARAVPIEAPRLVPVFCSPPTSGCPGRAPPTPSRCAGRPAPRCPALPAAAVRSRSRPRRPGRCWRTGPRCRPAWPAARGGRLAGVRRWAGTGGCRRRPTAGSVTGAGS